MQRAGKLDRRVTILEPGPSIDDGLTKRPGPLIERTKRWASWMPSNGRRLFETLGRETVSGGTFWMRDDSVTRSLNETAILRDEDGRDWTIVDINKIGRRRMIEFIVAAGDG